LIGEWSASYDTLVVDKLGDVMKGIEQTGRAPEFDREIPQARKDFLRNFVEAQMVAYEAQDEAVSRGWFYWTLKTEGGAFAEWDFLRGLREGWIPSIPGTNVSSTSLYGTCHDIAERTKDDLSIIHEFPVPSTLSEANWQGVNIDDDYVLSHAGNLGNAVGEESTVEVSFETIKTETAETHSWFMLFAVVFFCFTIWHVFFKQTRNRHQYTSVDSGSALHV
jgi:glucan 1,3-beta-glucosidase